MEWDTAAGHAIAEAAGAMVKCLPSEKKLTYNKADLRNSGFIVSRLADIGMG
jgi:3'(2'), 5'-bisphosphate nucleotidase